jgi:G3E family GTPase
VATLLATFEVDEDLNNRTHLDSTLAVVDCSVFLEEWKEGRFDPGSAALGKFLF